MVQVRADLATFFAALGNHDRLRILRHIDRTGPQTNQLTSEALGESPARLHFHTRALEQAGILRIVEQRPKGGVIEKYYDIVDRSSLPSGVL